MGFMAPVRDRVGDNGFSRDGDSDSIQLKDLHASGVDGEKSGEQPVSIILARVAWLDGFGRF